MFVYGGSADGVDGLRFVFCGERIVVCDLMFAVLYLAIASSNRLCKSRHMSKFKCHKSCTRHTSQVTHHTSPEALLHVLMPFVSQPKKYYHSTSPKPNHKPQTTNLGCITGFSGGSRISLKSDV
jgi:hypothetical protein